MYERPLPLILMYVSGFLAGYTDNRESVAERRMALIQVLCKDHLQKIWSNPKDSRASGFSRLR
jgi:hypothetical protein